MKFIIATCQFPIDRNIGKNLGYVLRQMRQAAESGAHIAHFPESCLSGCPGSEFESFAGFNWGLLVESTRAVMDKARKLGIWVILGSSHRLSAGRKPHNCLYVIDDKGRLADRYDKMFCTGHRKEAGGDLDHFSPGNHLSVFRIRGILCGLQICHDLRYPELYRAYKKRHAQVVFHSYHNGRMTKKKLLRYGNIWGVIVPPVMQASAANNYLWISANNTSARESCWSSFFVRPDGVITGKLKKNRTGILISTVDTGKKHYDASMEWRDRAMAGIFHSGTCVKDKRSNRRTLL